MPLDLPAITAKLVHGGRGGYCFEHNLLLSAVLRALGFEVRWLAARVMLNMPPGQVNARTHMLLRVEADGASYLADVGFGGLTLTSPLRLVAGEEQETANERVRLRALQDAFDVEALIGGEWRALYRFDLQEQQLADYELANWYLSHNPASHFVTSLVAARVEGDTRHALRNGVWRRYAHGRLLEERTLRTVGDVRAVLTDVFGIRLPDVDRLDEVLARTVST